MHEMLQNTVNMIELTVSYGMEGHVNLVIIVFISWRELVFCSVSLCLSL